jgi:hypothetical protein
MQNLSKYDPFSPQPAEEKPTPARTFADSIMALDGMARENFNMYQQASQKAFDLQLQMWELLFPLGRMLSSQPGSPLFNASLDKLREVYAKQVPALQNTIPGKEVADGYATL